MRTALFALLLAVPATAAADYIEFEPEPARAPAKKATKPAAKAVKKTAPLAPAKDPEPAPVVIGPQPPVAPAKDAAKDAPVKDTAAATDAKPNAEPATVDAPAEKPKREKKRTAAAGDAEGATSVVAELPSVAPHKKWIAPYGAIAGGVHLQSFNQPPDVQTGTQNPTVAVSRLGVRGGVGNYATFASEFEASLGGPLGYGSSVWEGQAAIAIRDQYLRYTRSGFSIAAGRIADPASFDFVSAHMGDLLYTDLYTRDPLLYAGADRGNGLFASYAITKQLTVAGTFHSTNPTGITGTLVIGGKLQPFDRPFYLAAAQVGNSQNNLPDQNLHIYFGSPSVLFRSEYVDAQAEVQMYTLDTQEAIMDDQSIRGYNLRLGARGHIPTVLGKLSPFANVSRNKNEILDPVDSKYRLPDLFKSYTFTTGADLDLKNSKTGIGFQYSLVGTSEPDHRTREHYLNLGTSYWFEDAVAIGLRASVFAQQISGESMTTGARSLFVTARLVLE